MAARNLTMSVGQALAAGGLNMDKPPNVIMDHKLKLSQPVNTPWNERLTSDKSFVSGLYATYYIIICDCTTLQTRCRGLTTASLPGLRRFMTLWRICHKVEKHTVWVTGDCCTQGMAEMQEEMGLKEECIDLCDNVCSHPLESQACLSE